MTTPPPIGTKVTVFGQYPGKVVKGPCPSDRALVEYKMPNSMVRGTIAPEDLELTKNTP